MTAALSLTIQRIAASLVEHPDRKTIMADAERLSPPQIVELTHVLLNKADCLLPLAARKDIARDLLRLALWGLDSEAGGR